MNEVAAVRVALAEPLFSAMDGPPPYAVLIQTKSTRSTPSATDSRSMLSIDTLRSARSIEPT